MKTFFNWLTSFFKQRGEPEVKEPVESKHFFPVSERIHDWARSLADRSFSITDAGVGTRFLIETYLDNRHGVIGWETYILLTKEAGSGLIYAKVPHLPCLQIEPFDVSQYSDEIEYFYQYKLWLLPTVNQILEFLGKPLYDDKGYLCHMKSTVSRDRCGSSLEMVRSAYPGFPVIRRICYSSAKGNTTSFFVDDEGKVLGASSCCDVFRNIQNGEVKNTLLCFNPKFRDIYEARNDKKVHNVYLDDIGLTWWLYPINSEYCSVRYIDKDGEKRILDNCETGEQFIDAFYRQVADLIDNPVL